MSVRQLSNSATQQLSNSATQQLSNSVNLVKFLLLGLFVSTIAACTLDVQITDTTTSLPSLESFSHKDPDFHHGEVVTTDNGIVFTGVFGEISEKQVLDNGIQFEGAFYE